MLEEKRDAERKNQDSKNSNEDNALMQKHLVNNYLNAITEYHDLGTGTEGVTKNGVYMVTLYSAFADHAANKVREIIDELFLPENLRVWQHKSKKYMNGGIVAEIPIKMVYQVENINITVAIPAYVEKLHLLEAGWLNPNVVEEVTVDCID